MVAGLDISDVVRIDLTISPLAIPTRNFGVPLFVGSSEVIDVLERQRQYANLGEGGADFDPSTDEYKALKAFFAQEPRPALAYVGRWAQTQTHAIMYGGVLAPADQLLALFTAVTAGSMTIWMDGIPRTISGLNFSTQTTLNGVANVLQTALAAKVAGTTLVWNPATDRFKLTSGTTGATSTLSWATPPTAWSSVDFSKQPANLDIITIAGTAVRFVTGTPIAGDVKIGADLPTTLANLQAYCATSTDSNLLTCTYSVFGSSMYILAAASGTGGNNITLVETLDSGNAMTFTNVTAGKLTGGAGTDISGIFKLSSATSAPAPVPGITAETPSDAMRIHLDRSHGWYGAEFVTSVQPTLQEHEDVATIIEGSSPARTYWYTTGDSTVLDPLTDADIASSMHTLNLARTCGQFSTTSKVAIASLFGRFANVDFRQNNSMITAKFKREPGVVAETLTETQAATIKAKKINVFVEYDVDIAIVQEGVMANGDFIDERFGCDWFSNALQVTLFNRLYTTPTKVPQTDAGMQILGADCKVVCQQAVFNGFSAPGLWNGPSFGQIKTGDILTTGFYIFIPPISTQAQADREARHAAPIQIGLKLAGAVHDVIVGVWVNR